MKNRAQLGRGREASCSDLDTHSNSLPGSASATHVSGPLAEPIEIAKFWKSARNRRQTIVLTLKAYEGHAFLDCRLFDTNGDGQSVPTAKGVTVGMTQLPDFVAGVKKAVEKAHELGLIAGDV
ncbi:PC4/YdbC family ssDNA-binding protein [Bradyrhizobium japonicum]|uniref:PC4/YdbC family ssDNA-binding protein n=1 Tax=Bradyrhizobium japonicum TaxID=375 RepID=UPI002714BD36|nr:PC4/YdbC family ssDNA-binding protein [Bradyrhizobium japonicum]WLB58472.1 PC4/YdbC family ssDNA-binding protein [Bradyrhizobium japonicum]WLB59730.1 PC4/YdbC family ssDNA-binding protein [Bradyrhizobium japonicum]